MVVLCQVFDGRFLVFSFRNLVRKVYILWFYVPLRSAIDCNLSFGRSPRRTPGSPTVYDVIFNQRVSGPAIYTKVRISFWLVVTSIINGNITNLGICFCANCMRFMLIFPRELHILSTAKKKGVIRWKQITFISGP